MKWKEDIARIAKDLMGTGRLDSRAFASVKRAVGMLQPQSGAIDASTKVIDPIDSMIH